MTIEDDSQGPSFFIGSQQGLNNGGNGEER